MFSIPIPIYHENKMHNIVNSFLALFFTKPEDIIQKYFVKNVIYNMGIIKSEFFSNF